MKNSKSILLTFDVEDWFQVENLKKRIPFSSWTNCELRVENNTKRLLDFLDGVSNGGSDSAGPLIKPLRATFFVLGWIAKRVPQLVREIASRGHEVASHGFYHNLSYMCSMNDLREDLLDSKKLIEDITGVQVQGYRAPSFSIAHEILALVAECGYIYDSSYNSFAGNAKYGSIDFAPNSCRIGGQVLPALYELPISNLKIGGVTIPLGGGGYFRLMPIGMFKRAVRSIINRQDAYLFYLHPWEIDPGQPRVKGLPWFSKFRHYINLHKTLPRLGHLLESLSDCAFLSCNDYVQRYLAVVTSDYPTRKY